ncbi:hypothetical protein Bca52824_096693 [Brassica carinata]|uniref:Transmembrane 9 superfamily member n=1 Tax=Brassica carinata TaxID=52824 RepID=A0A8X7TGX0_BRACI|nr:hypothetical protein Bca52824_096693 [Brassica carinata]
MGMEASDPRSSSSFCSAFTLLSFYLPGVAPQDFEKGDELKVKVNKLTSIKTQLPYSLKCGRHRCAMFSASLLMPRQPKPSKIDDEYRVNMILDNLPLVVPIERGDPGSPAVVYQLGYHVGLKGQYEGAKSKSSLCTITWRLDITEMCKLILQGLWDLKSNLTVLSMNTIGVKTSSGDMQVFLKQSLWSQYFSDFLLLLLFQESEVKWASRWDAYLLMNDNQIHWFSIVNSLMIVLFLSGMVAMIMLRTLYRDISRYNELETQEEAQEETGWKLVHGDVFRIPTNSDLLCVTLVSPSTGWSDDGHASALVFMGLFAGYASSRLYKMFKGTEWKRIAFRTAFLFSCLLFVLNALIWGQSHLVLSPSEQLVLCYFQLCSEDYLVVEIVPNIRLISAVSIPLRDVLLLHSFRSKLVSAMLYFGYMLIASYAFLCSRERLGSMLVYGSQGSSIPRLRSIRGG